MDTIHYNGENYPAFQASGFAARFAFPFAAELCNGVGYDIGCNRKEWCLPFAIPIDPLIDWTVDAYNLPDRTVDFIFSSHCLEHLRNWVEALDYWATKIRSGGILFLYLPHPTQQYWLPWGNKKHIHILFPEVIEQYLRDRQVWKNIFVTGRDLNHSFYVVAEKK